MEKVLDILKGLLAGFVELIMHPVSKVTETVQKEDIKKGAIKAVILAAVLAVVNVLSRIRIIHIFITTSKAKDSAMDDLNAFVTILKMFGIYLLIIAAIALVLFIISKLVKDQKSFPYTLSMTVNSGIVYTVGATLGLILSFWTPLSILVISIAALHSGLTLLVSFMSSLANVDTDRLILVAVVVLAIVAIVVAIISMIKDDVKLSSYADSKYSEMTKDSKYHTVEYQMTSALSSLSDALSSSTDSLSSLSNLF